MLKRVFIDIGSVLGLPPPPQTPAVRDKLQFEPVMLNEA